MKKFTATDNCGNSKMSLHQTDSGSLVVNLTVGYFLDKIIIKDKETIKEFKKFAKSLKAD